MLRPQGEFCLAQDAAEVSTDRRYSDHEGVYAAYCDSCASQVGENIILYNVAND